MKTALVWVLVIASQLAGAQDFSDVDRSLIQEKSYQALFYLRPFRYCVATDLQIRFAVNNRLIDAWQSGRINRDSIAILIAANEGLKNLVKRPSEKHYFLLLKAIALSNNGRDAEALEIFKSLSGASHPIRAIALLKTGDALQNQRKFEESLSAFTGSLNLFKSDSAKFYFKIYRAHYLAGISRKSLRQYARAVSEYQLALKVLDAIPEPMLLERSKLLNNLANVYSESSSYHLAATTYREAIRIKTKIDQDSVSMATTYANLATFYVRFGNFTEARDIFDRAVTLMPRAKNAGEQIKRNLLTNNFCSLLRELTEYERARNEVQTAIRESTELLSPVHPSVVLLKLRNAEMANFLFKFEEAHAQLSALDTINSLLPENDPLLTDLKTVKAYYYFKTGRYDSCLAFSEQNLQIREQRNDVMAPEYFIDASRAGNACWKMGDTARTYLYYWKALQSASRQNRSTDMLTMQRTLSITHFEAGDLDSAQFYTRQMLKLNFISDQEAKGERSFIDVNSAIECFLQLAELAYKRYSTGHDASELREAEAQISFCIELIAKKRNALLSDQDKFAFGEYVDQVFPIATDIYYQCYKLIGHSGYLDKLLLVSELTKSQSLLSNLKQMNIQSFAGVTEAVHKKEKSISSAEKNLIHDAAWQMANGKGGNQELIAEQQNRLALLQDDKSSFIDSVRKNLPGYYQLKYDQTMVTISELQKQLSSNSALISYLPGTKRIYAIAVSAKTSTVLPMERITVIDKEIPGLRNHLKFKFEKELAMDGEMLYQQLLSDVDSVFSKNKETLEEMIIVPYGILSLLPFELLIDKTRKGNPHYVIERCAVYYDYSATLWWQKATDSKIGLKKGLAGYAPRFGGNVKSSYSGFRESEQNFVFDELPETNAEVEGIAAVYRKKLAGASKIYNEQASELNFKRTTFSDYSFLHLATHGFVGMNGKNSSGLALQRGSGNSEDDILFADEIYSLRIPVDLVTLSACETGLGRYQSGEGLVGLARAFFYSGARSVLVSLWKVQDKSTSDLMISFYDHYFESTTDKAKALQRAKIDMIHSRSYKNPFYWAPFILLGAN